MLEYNTIIDGYCGPSVNGEPNNSIFTYKSFTTEEGPRGFELDFSLGNYETENRQQVMNTCCKIKTGTDICFLYKNCKIRKVCKN